MAIRKALVAAGMAALALVSACKEPAGGPIVVSAIGAPPKLQNPNLESLDQPSAILIQAIAQGLVRFDAAGQIEPALAQSWIVSNDGLRYTFRLARTNWSDGRPVTAEQVAARLRAATARASKNRLKPLLGAIAGIEPMTENVLEITLKAPRPNFLQLLAQPEMAIVRKGVGTGPFEAEEQADDSVLLRFPVDEEEEEEPESPPGTEIILRGDSAAIAVARFARELSHLVTGGTAGNLPIARAASLPAAALRFDPVAGLFGLEFLENEGPLAEPEVRRALNMAVDRDALVAALGVPGLGPQVSLVPPGMEELPDPALPVWAGTPLPARQAQAAEMLDNGVETPLKLRVALPEGPGYRLVFAHLRRDWRAIGVDAEAVEAGKEADLRLVDSVAPATLVSWYLRRFSCGSSAVCSGEADLLLEQARNANIGAERQAQLADAQRVLSELTPFIPLTTPVRWSLVSPRLSGYQLNPFARRFIGGLVEGRP